jgi:hypothetical protein
LAVAASWDLTAREVNTDRGAPFYANRRFGADPGLGRFQPFLAEHGIHPAASRVNNPEPNGKVERLGLEYDTPRWRFPGLPAWIDGKHDEVHERRGARRPRGRRFGPSYPRGRCWGCSRSGGRRSKDAELQDPTVPFLCTSIPAVAKGNGFLYSISEGEDGIVHILL